jgi:hypothetical protein
MMYAPNSVTHVVGLLKKYLRTTSQQTIIMRNIIRAPLSRAVPSRMRLKILLAVVKNLLLTKASLVASFLESDYREKNKIRLS